MKNLLRVLSILVIFCFSVANAAQIILPFSDENGTHGIDRWKWSDYRPWINTNFTELYTQHNFITITGPVNLDELDVFVDANTLQISEFVTLSGVPAHSTDYGIFDGSTYPDNLDAKELFQVTETAIEGKQDTSANLDIYSGITPKADMQLFLDADDYADMLLQLSLEDVDNTADLDKPISILTQNALDAKVGTSGDESVAGIKTFSSFPVSPLSAPTTDYQIANKKYVDDNGGAMIYPDVGIPLSTGSDWGISYTLTTLAAALDGEDFTPTGAMDTTGVSSNLSGPIVLTETATLPTPATPGKIFIYTGLSEFVDSVLGHYNASGDPMYHIATDGPPSTTGDQPTFNSVTGKMEWEQNGTGAGITEVATDPGYNDMSNGQWSVSKTSGDLFGRGGDGLFYEITGATPVQYFTLTITDPGNNDAINTTDGFILCGNGNTDCIYNYPSGATPELTAIADTGREFDNWTGDATETSTTTNPDTIFMSEAKSAGADFSATTPTCSATPGDIVIGSDTTAGGESGADNIAQVLYSKYVATDNCDTDVLHTVMYLTGATSYGSRMAVFADNTGTIGAQIETTTETIVPGSSQVEDLAYTLNSTVSWVQGTTYWIARWTEVGPGQYQMVTAGDSTGSGYQYQAYVSTGDFPTPSRTPWARVLSVYGVAN